MSSPFSVNFDPIFDPISLKNSKFFLLSDGVFGFYSKFQKKKISQKRSLFGKSKIHIVTSPRGSFAASFRVGGEVKAIKE